MLLDYITEEFWLNSVDKSCESGQATWRDGGKSQWELRLGGVWGN